MSSWCKIAEVPDTITIALVDDDPSVRRAVSRLLRSHDYACLAYESAEAAMADPAISQADCLVLDIQLSGMNGFALRDHLLRNGIQTPCLFVTAHAETNTPEWIRCVGNHPCVLKPFDDAQLMAAIQSLLENHDQPAQP